jgi:hypothetical protein
MQHTPIFIARTLEDFIMLKSKNFSRLLWLLGLAGCLPLFCPAQPGPAGPDVAGLVESSNLIVVGRVTSINKGGIVTVGLPGGAQVSARSFLAALRVDSVLKGNPEETQLTFEFVIPELPSGGFQAVPDGQYGIFFLRGKHSGYKPTDRTYPFLPAVRNFEPPPGSALDRVTSVLGHVLTAPQVPDSDRLRALEALRSVRTDLATQALRQAMSASAGDMRLYIAAALVARNDLTGLAPVASALLHPNGLSKYVISVLGGSLTGLREPRAVPALSKLIMSSDTATRRGAVVGLRQSHSTAALVPLSQALSDADVWIRYDAVAGMGEITGQDVWTPAVGEFLQHQDKYLSHWREWARTNLPHSE